MNARNIQFRYDEKLAEEVFSNIVSSKKALRILAGMILDICESANGLNPLGWEVTLEKDSICVNVGRIALMIVGNKYGVAAEDVNFYCGSVNPDLKRRFMRIKTYKELYQSVPVPGAVLPLRISEVAKLTNREVSLITDSQLNLVEESCELRRGLSLWHRSHSPAVIEYFNRLCSRDVPQPQYIIDPHPQ